MKEDYYRQCSLRRVNGQVDVAWIPEQYARKGKYIRIKRGEHWENGWLVEIVYDRQPYSKLAEHERTYLVQRDTSDV